MKRKSEYKDMWVYIEHDGAVVRPVSLELCCETRKLCDAAGEKLAAVIVGDLPDEEKAKVVGCGVDKIIHVTGSGYKYFNTDAYSNLFTELCLKYEPSAVMVGGTVFGRDFAPQFACRLKTGCTSDATELVYDKQAGGIEFIEPAVGGKLFAVITLPEARPQVGTIRPGTFKYAPAGERPHTVVEEKIDFPEEKIRTHILGFTEEEFDESLNIADAEVIICVGNSVKPGSVPMYRELAELMGGKLACSRPVFDRGLLPFKLVIGQSGVVVKPKIYFGFGISGAINHMSGATDSGKIVAVNTDPEAAIFGYCDYGIVGDMDEVCEMMIEKLKAAKK